MFVMSGAGCVWGEAAVPGHHQSIPDPARPAPGGGTPALCHSELRLSPPRWCLVCVSPPQPTHRVRGRVQREAEAGGEEGGEQEAGRRHAGLRSVLWCHKSRCCVDTLVTAAPAAALTCHQPRSSPARPATSLHSASVPATSTTTTSYFYSAVTSTVCLT